MLRWLFFDMGSTLIDESACVEARLRAVAEAAGLPLNVARLRAETLARDGCAFAVKALAGELNVPVPPWPQTLERPFPDAAPVLGRLRERFRLGIIANQSIGSEERLQKWGLLTFFDVVVASAEEGVSKPDPRIFELALERAGCAPGEAVMIGDRLDNDILPAKRLGMRTVWVRQSWGGVMEAVPEEARPDWSVQGLSELCALLEGLEKVK